MALPEFAAEDRTAAPCCGAFAVGRSLPSLSIDRLSHTAANPPHAAAGSNVETNRRTDGRPLNRPRSAYMLAVPAICAF